MFSSDPPPPSRYDGPVDLRPIPISPTTTLRIVVPADPDRLLDAPDVQARHALDDYMPYWAYIWPSAILLARRIAAQPFSRGLRVLELGSGLGIGGLAALAVGFYVTFSDHDEAAFDFVRRSIEASELPIENASFRRIDWRDPPSDRYPLILGSDLKYELRLVPHLAHTLATMLDPGGQALLSSPFRPSVQAFIPALEPLGLTATVEECSTPGLDDAPFHGTIHHVTWSTTPAPD